MGQAEQSAHLRHVAQAVRRHKVRPDQKVDFVESGPARHIVGAVAAIGPDDAAHLAERPERPQFFRLAPEMLHAADAGQHVIIQEERVPVVIGAQRHVPTERPEVVPPPVQAVYVWHRGSRQAELGRVVAVAHGHGARQRLCLQRPHYLSDVVRAAPVDDDGLHLVPVQVRHAARTRLVTGASHPWEALSGRMVQDAGMMSDVNSRARLTVPPLASRPVSSSLPTSCRYSSRPSLSWTPTYQSTGSSVAAGGNDRTSTAISTVWSLTCSA